MTEPIPPPVAGVVVATVDHGRLLAMDPYGSSPPDRGQESMPPAPDPTRPKPLPYELRRDLHRLAPEDEMVVVRHRWKDSYQPYEDRGLYSIYWSNRRSGFLWVAHNSRVPTMPAPPDYAGAVSCWCVDPVRNVREPRYGTSWSTFLAEPYLDHWFQRPYTQDVLAGAGPCPLRDEPGFLTQWSRDWIVLREGRYFWSKRFEGQMVMHESTDAQLAGALGVARDHIRSPTDGLATEAGMKEAWGRYLHELMKGRANLLERCVGRGEWRIVQQKDPALWASLKRDGYFTSAVGAWFVDAVARRSKLLDLMNQGLPVYYKWTPRLEELAPQLGLPPEARMRLFEPTPTGRVPSPRPGRDGSFPYPDTPNPGRRADQARAENVAADTRAASRPRPVAPSASGISSSTLRESQAIAPPENAAETPAEAPLVSAANTAPRPPGKTSENFPTAGRDYELVGRWSPHMRAADGLRLVPRPRIDGRFRGRVEGGAEMFQAERGHGLGDHRRAVLFISNGGLVSQFLDYTNQQGV
ncbi:hypothetical protein AURDEDRAFT_177822, partial [Auricularia subglabra TFB-10046 SS5]